VLSVQAVLSSPDAFRSVEDDFCILQQTKTKLTSPQEEEQFEAAVEQLRSRWEEVKRKIEELHPRVQGMAGNFSEYKEKLQSLVNWVEEAEQVCNALERVDDYNEFLPLMQTFQVMQAFSPLVTRRPFPFHLHIKGLSRGLVAQGNSRMPYSDTFPRGTHLFPYELTPPFSAPFN